MSFLRTSQEVASLPKRVAVSSGRQKVALFADKWTAELTRRLVHGKLERVRGRLDLVEGRVVHCFGDEDPAELHASIQIRDPAFYRLLVLGGALGAAEAYIRGYWDTTDLTGVLRLIARSSDVLSSVEGPAAKLVMPSRTAVNWLRRNTLSGSRRNIAAHYDLSNDFFQLMLDPTMTYSCGVFANADTTLEQASVEKYDRICRKLALRPNDRIIEIGTGWGGFAIHAASRYGCHVTTTTISKSQCEFARQRVESLGLLDRITLLMKDYRHVTGTFDKLVSIEMIEAVGESFLPGYFAKCSALLKPSGCMALQAITIPDDRFADYRKSVDFIRQYIFPGGFLPSMSSMTRCVTTRTDFRFFHYEDFGPHYARTLAEWSALFQRHLTQVSELGFSNRFIRTWEFYLAYCEAAFQERLVGVCQLLLTKPDCRLAPVLAKV